MFVFTTISLSFDEHVYCFSCLTPSDHSSVSLTMSQLHNLLSSCDLTISVSICSVIKFGFLCVCHPPVRLLFSLCAANMDCV